MIFFNLLFLTFDTALREESRKSSWEECRFAKRDARGLIMRIEGKFYGAFQRS